MKDSSHISAIVLAAGASTRMGSAKQLLHLGGRRVLQHVLDNVRRSAASEMILVLGHAAEEIQSKLELKGVQVVMNDDYRQGMGSSLKAGLSAIDQQAKAALIILADQPFVRGETLDRLIAEHSRTKAQIVIPTYNGFRGNPVLLDQAVFAEVMALSGDIGCRAIFGNHLEGIVKLPVDDAGVLLDLDQQSDYQRLRPVTAHWPESFVRLQKLEIRESTGSEARPAPELIIVGKDAMALALAKLARFMQFTVTMVDAFATIAEIPEADRVLHVLDFSLLGPSSDRHVVVASRGACDEEAIEQAGRVNSSYIALVANRKRGQEVLRALELKGLRREKLASVRVPAGIEIGAATPQEIALSIMAELIAERRKRENA